MTKGRPQNPPRTDFERRLRELMAAAKIPSYAELARRAEVTTQTIDNACRGDYTPSLETMVKLAGALRCKVDDLLSWECLACGKKEASRQGPLEGHSYRCDTCGNAVMLVCRSCGSVCCNECGHKVKQKNPQQQPE